jgi:hypothetical protein
MSQLWPVAEAAQADYEHLRATVLAGLVPMGAPASRFEAEGLIGLIRRPAAVAVFTATLHGAARPAWTPYCDPRLEALAEAYTLVLSAEVDWDAREIVGDRP